MLMRQIVANIKMCIIVCMFYAQVFTADDEASGWTAMITRACVLPHHRLIMSIKIISAEKILKILNEPNVGLKILAIL